MCTVSLSRAARQTSRDSGPICVDLRLEVESSSGWSPGFVMVSSFPSRSRFKLL